MPPPLNFAMAKCWKLMTLKGTLATLLGLGSAGWLLWLYSQPADIFGASIFLQWANLAAFLILYLGLYALVDGVCAFTMGYRLFGQMCRLWALVGKGLLSLGLVAALWLWPRALLQSLPLWIAVWAFFVGVLEIIQGFDPQGYPPRKRQCFWSGTITWALGVLLIFGHFGGRTLIGVVSGYAFLSAVPVFLLAFHLRGLAKSLNTGEKARSV